MPKLLENLPRQLLEEAAAQIARQGYAKTTVRSVASACGVAVGTVYNYFPSKEQLIAAFVAADWQKALAAMQPAQGDGAEDCLRRIYEQLRAFTQKHNALFTDPDAARAAAGVMLFRHLQLREQLACIVAPYFPGPDGFHRCPGRSYQRPCVRHLLSGMDPGVSFLIFSSANIHVSAFSH